MPIAGTIGHATNSRPSILDPPPPPTTSHHFLPFPSRSPWIQLPRAARGACQPARGSPGGRGGGRRTRRAE
eukprot:3913041-Pyramimonas_sp.AAC.1